MTTTRCLQGFTLLTALMVCGPAFSSQPVHGQAMHGEPKYPAGFTHFDYVNPNAPKGGEVHLAAIGTFDNLNPYILKGVSAAGLGNVYQTLTTDSSDEAFSQYGEIAESIEVADDKTWVSYVIRPGARWHDGQPITADDVVFSVDIFKHQGHPFYRSYYAGIESVEKISPRKVKIHFKGADNAELAMISGQMNILPKHYWQGRDFTKTTLEPPLGSGPYKISAVDPGHSITYQRVRDWWAKDLPVNKGRFNFDTIRYDYYRDNTVALEAFKAGEYDFRQENNSKLWATAYTGPPFKAGKIIKQLIPNQRPTGMQGFVFNTRREFFKDSRVRAALAEAFDFEWTNKNLFYGQYTRTASYFSNSELAAKGLPDPAERALLEPYRKQIPPEVFTRAYQPPKVVGPRGLRKNLRKAIKLLAAAGWIIQDGELVHQKTGKPMHFEFLLVQPAFERIVLPFTKNLKKLGITARVRTVDSAQYQKRLETFDFDMVVGSFGQSLSPGNEQRDFWGSKNADIPGSRNIIGVKDPVVDALIDQIIAAPDRKQLVIRTRALDRVLQWGHYLIPNWHVRAYRIANWNFFGRPKITPKYALGFDTWWIHLDQQQRIRGK